MSAEHAIQFWFDDAQLSPLGEGHIHDTYQVVSGEGRYVLQRVNHVVFNDPDLVMAQTQRVLQCWSQQNDYVVPKLVVNREGVHGMWTEGEFWRVWELIADTQVVDPLEHPHQAQQAGQAFGALQKQLEAMPGAPFVDVIPGFLQLHHYLRAYDAVAADAPADLHALIQQYRHLAHLLEERNTTIHGDCKINNLLFDESGRDVVAIIDFDTAMFGHWAWDFGDLVRSVCYSTGAANVDYYAACLRGFSSQQLRCSPAECVAAPGYVTLMLGVRFLTDHLRGDVYFRVAAHGDNLNRAREQFELFESFMGVQRQMQEATRAVLV